MCIKMLHFSNLVCVLFPNLPDLTYGVKLVLLSEMGSLFLNLFYNAISSLMMEAVRTSETSVDNHFTRQYNPEDSSEHNAISVTRLYSIDEMMMNR
jgi:hypothetical protein